MNENKHISFGQNDTIRWDTAESERINFVDGNIRRGIQPCESDEARTYRTKQRYEAITSDGKGGISISLLFALIPPINGVGFLAMQS